MKYDLDEKLTEAYRLAEMSPDVSNQNGAVIYQDDIVLSQGWNHFYQGVPEEQNREPTETNRTTKYDRIAHAEFDCCINLAHRHIAISEAAIMFCPWATCIPCAIALIGAQVPKLVIHKERCVAFMATRAGQDEAALADWQPAIDESSQWLTAAGVETIVFEGPVESYVGPGININGRKWHPHTLEFV
jgi:deoxycytidylate deaminase